MLPSEILQARHDELAFGQLKWVNRYPEERDGECCLVLYGDYALTKPGGNFREATFFLCRALRRKPQGQEFLRSLVRWNDYRNRKLDEVLAALLKAKRLALKVGR